MNSQDLFISVVKHVINELGSDENDILACMIMLHTQDIFVTLECEMNDVVWPVGEPHKLCAITHCHASEVVAAALGHESEQGIIDLWYSTYCTRTPFELLEDVPEPWMGRVLNAMTCVKGHPLVETVADAD